MGDEIMECRIFREYTVNLLLLYFPFSSVFEGPRYHYSVRVSPWRRDSSQVGEEKVGETSLQPPTQVFLHV